VQQCRSPRLDPATLRSAVARGWRFMPTPHSARSPATTGAERSIASGSRCGPTSSEPRAGRRSWRYGGPGSPVAPLASRGADRLQAGDRWRSASGLCAVVTWQRLYVCLVTLTSRSSTASDQTRLFGALYRTLPDRPGSVWSSASRRVRRRRVQERRDQRMQLAAVTRSDLRLERGREEKRMLG
jgi:hypothetical protein